MNILHILVSIGGLLVSIGWALKNPVLTAVHPDYVTMKIATAVSFCLASAVRVKPTIYAATLAITGGMAWSFGAWFGAQELLDLNDVESVARGIPSIATACGFVSCIVSAYAYLHEYYWVSVIVPSVIVLIGSVGVLGYVTDNATLRWYSDGQSSAMAMHTAVLFTVWGIGDLRQVLDKKRLL